VNKSLLFPALLLAVSLLCLPVRALTGSADSAVGSLETIRPTLTGLTVSSGLSIDSTFSEPMLSSSVTVPQNYLISGDGAGTLLLNPSTVTGNSSVTLTWANGEMRDGATVSLTVIGVQDLLGNPIDTSANEASGVGVGLAPVFSGLSVTPSIAGAGDVVSISFSTSEALDGDPEVTVNGNPAVRSGKAAYAYEYTVLPGDPFGTADIVISGFDLAGNLGGISSSSALTIAEAGVELPIRAWSLILIFVIAGAIMLNRRPKAAITLLATLGFASIASGATPVVSNVTFEQKPNASGTEVLITYDIVSPVAPSFITVSLSKNGGVDNFPFTATAISGDLFTVSTGTGRTILWNIAADFPNESIPNARIRVTADNGDIPEYTIQYLAGVGGTITGAATQTAFAGSTSSPVNAIANPGFAFVDWSDGSTSPTRSDLFTADRTLTANFTPQYTLTYTAGAGGSISGLSPQTVNSGDSGTSVTAVANSGFAFLSWSDGVLTATRTDSNVQADLSVTANFTPQYTLTYTAGPGGAITGLLVQSVNSGDTGTEVTAVADSGFVFLNWSDGVLTATRTDSNVQADLSVTANFTPQYTLTYTAGTGGTLSGNTSQTVISGNNGTAVTAVPNSGFAFLNWSDGKTSATRTDSNVQANLSVTANFQDLYVMIPVPAGSFDMGRTSSGDDAAGGSDELPVHTVSLDAYEIGKFEVTNQRVCDVFNWADDQNLFTNASTATAFGRTLLSLANAECHIEYVDGVFQSEVREGIDANGNPQMYSMANHPVVHMSWFGAAAFCNWLSQIQGLTPVYNTSTWVANFANNGYHLPTEAQWERAAAWDGAKHWIYGFTSDTLSGRSRVNHLDGGSAVNPLGLLTSPPTAPVGWFNGIYVSPNGSVSTIDSVSPIGAYDMSGNLAEWCNDWYAAGYYATSPASNPEGPATGSAKVRRGGSWLNGFGNNRSAVRPNFSPASTRNFIGFRLAK
jgi:formylglycine-generating enzyme required for sulfatase activity